MNLGDYLTPNAAANKEDIKRIFAALKPSKPKLGGLIDTVRDGYNEKADAIGESIGQNLDYYLGPTGIPDKLRAAGGLLEFTDAADMKAGADARTTAYQNPNARNISWALLNSLTAAAPFVSSAMVRGGANVANDAIGSMSDDIGQYLSKQDGGIKAYHGSPHDFDKFSLDNIGTGEGAQAYGHGLYFADNEATARSYRDALADQYTKVDGLRVHKTGHGGRRFGDLDVNQRALLNELQSSANAGGLTAKEVITERLAQIDARMGTYLKQSKGDDFGAHLAKGHLERNAKQKKLLTDLLDAGVEFENTGRMYEVDINANPEDFLDWDKTVGSQSRSVKDRLGWTEEAEKAYLDARNADDDGLLAALQADTNAQYNAATLPTPVGAPSYSATGAEVLKKDKLFNDAGAVRASNALSEQGIPGIKYLDQGSRGAGVGTSNYVVFDDKLITILKKYGLLGMVGGGAAAAQSEQPGT